MNSLDIVYYLNEDNNVKAVIQKKGTTNKDYTKIKFMIEQINDKVLSKEEKTEAKTMIYLLYYLKLISDGYNIEQLYERLKQEESEVTSLDKRVALYKEKLILSILPENKEYVTDYVSGLLNDKVIEEIEEEHGIYRVKKFK